MAKKKPYPNTSWGRGAAAEDEDDRVDKLVRHETPRTYVFTYEQTKVILSQLKSPDAIRSQHYQRPAYDPERPPTDMRAYRVEAGLAEVRREGIDDALANKPPRYELRK